MKFRSLIVSLFLSLSAVNGIAQTPATRIQNPTAVVFTPSPDHANISTYKVEIVNSAGAVIQTIDVGKPTPDASNECRASLNVQPIAFGAYTIVMRSVGSGITGPASLPTDGWDRAPGAPSGKPRVQ